MNIHQQQPTVQAACPATGAVAEPSSDLQGLWEQWWEACETHRKCSDILGDAEKICQALYPPAPRNICVTETDRRNLRDFDSLFIETDVEHGARGIRLSSMNWRRAYHERPDCTSGPRNKIIKRKREEWKRKAKAAKYHEAALAAIGEKHGLPAAQAAYEDAVGRWLDIETRILSAPVSSMVDIRVKLDLLKEISEGCNITDRFVKVSNQIVAFLNNQEIGQAAKLTM